ncbi:hypothetical protein Tco_0289700 [Tanacetum coccineum]
MAGPENDTPPPPPPPTQTPVVTQTPHTMSTIKLPILKKGEYDIWAMKMEHYLAHTDYPIWEVIQKGNGPVSVSTDTNGVIKVLPPKTAEETLARERERKARTTLLMALPEDHLAKFHKMTDAKEMWDAIKSRFGGNDESKKMQKYILKQQFEGFSISNSEGLHKGYDRFQSLLSQLEIHGAGVSTEDANQKFLRSYDAIKSSSVLYLLFWSLKILRLLRSSNLNVAVNATAEEHERTNDIKYWGLWGWRNCFGTASYNKWDIKWQETLRGVGFFVSSFYLDQDIRGKVGFEKIEWRGSQKGERADESDKSAREHVRRGIVKKEEDGGKTRAKAGGNPKLSGIYIPSGPDKEIDESQFTYGPKQSKPSESDTRSSDFNSCESNSSEETLESMPEPVVNEPKVVSQPKVWSDAPIIEEYESDSDDDCVSTPSKE